MRLARLACIAVLLASCGSGGGGGDDAGDTVDPDSADMDAEGDGPSDPTAEDPHEEDPALEEIEEDGPECTTHTDCDDGDPCTVDTCDPAEQECSHAPVDADGDGYPAEVVDGTDCGGTDCDDDDGDVHPDSTFIDCEGGDMDCDGLADDDEDGDGHVTDECTGGDDCDDADDGIFPGSTLLGCDAVDHDCNGEADVDNDGDGADAERCPDGDDCDDADAAIHPGAAEAECDGRDTDCDGDMHATEDADGDGWANATCVATGFEADCDDGDDQVHPGATEICDLVDQNCDGAWTDAADADDDGDDHLDDACPGGDDCDDTRADTWLGAPEVCGDGVDQDCDGSADALALMDEVRVTDHTGSSGWPSLTWSGSEYGIAWSDGRDGNREIYFARLDADGAKLLSDTRVTDAMQGSEEVELVWNGSVWGMSWYDLRDGDREIYFATVDAGGATVVSDVRVTEAAAYSWHPDLAWTGSNWAVAWREHRDGNGEIYAAVLDGSGVLLHSDVNITSDAASSDAPAIAWSGSRIGLLWPDNLSGGTYDQIYFSSLLPDLTVDVAPVEVSSISYYSYRPDAVWTGSEYAYVWADSFYHVYFHRVDETGANVGTMQEITDWCIDAWPSIDWDGSGFGVAWEDGEGAAATEIDFAYVDGSGTMVGSAVRLTDQPSYQAYPSVAWAGSRFGVAWEDNRDSTSEIYLGFVAFCE